MGRVAALATVLLSLGAPLAAVAQPHLHLGPEARFVFDPVPEADSYWVEGHGDGEVFMSFPVDEPEFVVIRDYGSTWRFRVRAMASEADPGPWSDWSRDVRWLAPMIDCNGDTYIGMAEFACLRRAFGCHVCGTECLDGPCP
jgi:hypothetical protein